MKTYLRLLGAFIIAVSGVAYADPNPYVTPIELYWCWDEDDGSCEPGYGESFTYASSEIVYMGSGHESGHYIDSYYITGHHADIEAIAVTLSYDTDQWEPYRGYIWYPGGEMWVWANDWQYAAGGVAGFAEWQSNGDYIPWDWDYDNGWYVALAIFEDVSYPYGDDLWIEIFDDNMWL